VGEFLTYAAATGDLRTVKALLVQGAPVDVTDRQGKTGLHAAAVGNKVAVLEYLLSHGATVDAINRFGDSPLAEAVGAKSAEAAAFLAAHGGHNIRGTEAQRDKAVHDIVSDDIARMDAERKREKPSN
jgi:ankyrin repeat protein